MCDLSDWSSSSTELTSNTPVFWDRRCLITVSVSSAVSPPTNYKVLQSVSGLTVGLVESHLCEECMSDHEQSDRSNDRQVECSRQNQWGTINQVRKAAEGVNNVSSDEGANRHLCGLRII